MSKWIDNWENYVRFHDDKANEFLGEDDLTVKGKFSFLNKKFKLSAKTKFATKGGNLTSGLDYTLTHNVSPNTSYNLIHRPDLLTLDGSFHLGDYNNSNIYLYAKSDLTQNEKEKKLPSTFKLRIFQEGNRVLSVGVENVDLVNNPKPDVLSVLGLYGLNVQNGWRAYFGPYYAFQLSSRKLHSQKYLIGVKHSKFSGWLEASSVPGKPQKDAKAETTDAPTKDNKVAFRFDAVANSKTKFGGDLVVNVNDLRNVDLKLYGEHKVDDLTTVKAKFEEKSKLTVGLTRKFGNLVNFGFVSAFTLNSVAGRTTEGKDVKSHHIKTKFGLLAEFNDAL